jgi:hypothetical protein
MTSTHDKDQTLLPALFTGVLENGGLEMLQTQESLFMLSDSVEELFTKHQITSTKSLLSLVFMMHTFGDSAFTVPLLTEGYKRGILQKNDLITLYLSQSEDARVNKPLVTLSDIWNMPYQAFPKAKDEDSTSLTSWFSKEEIVAMANRVVTIFRGDVDMFFQNWFYYSNDIVPFSKEFLLYWFNYEGYGTYAPSGKIASLIAIALFRAYPEDITQDAVLEKMSMLAERDPESHGIYRYCALAFQIAGSDVLQRNKAIDGWVNAIIRMIWVSKHAFSRPEFALELFLDDTGISKDEKAQALVKIHKACQEKASVYTNIIEVTKEQLKKL